MNSRILSLILLLFLFSTAFAQKEYQILRHVGYTADDLPVFNGLYEVDGENASDLFTYDDNMGEIEMLKEKTAGYIIQYKNNTALRLSDDRDNILVTFNGEESELLFSEDPDIQSRLSQSLALAMAPMYPFVSLSDDGKSLYMPIDAEATEAGVPLGVKDLSNGEISQLNIRGNYPNLSGNFVHFNTPAPGAASGLDINVLNLTSMESETLPIRMPGGLSILAYKPVFGDGSSVFLYNNKLYFFDYYSKKFELINNDDLTDKRKFLSIYYSKKNDELMYLRLSASGSRFLRKPIEIQGDGNLTWEDVMSGK